MPADAASDPASLASVLDQIENLSISEGKKGLSLNDVSAELKQMSLTSGGGEPKPECLGPPVCTDVPLAGGDQRATEQVGDELRQMGLTSANRDLKSLEEYP